MCSVHRRGVINGFRSTTVFEVAVLTAVRSRSDARKTHVFLLLGFFDPDEDGNVLVQPTLLAKVLLAGGY